MAAGNFGTHKIEKLNEENYESWKIQMKSILICNELWSYVNGSNIKTEANAIEWDGKDEKALAFLFLSVNKSQINNIKKCETSKNAWDTLRDIYESKGPVRKAILYKKLYKMKKETNVPMGEYVNKFVNVAEKLEEAGIKIPGELLSIMLLNSLPAEYESFCTAIESRDDLPTIDIIKLKLIELEARFEEKGTYNKPEESNDALLTKTKPKVKYDNTRSKYNRIKFNKMEIKCNVCGKMGHKTEACWFRNKQNNHCTKEKAMNAITLSTNPMMQDFNEWCLDSGATRHMCKYSNYFINMNRDIKMNVYTAAKEYVQCKGIGDVRLKIPNYTNTVDSIRLCDVMYIPNLRHNLISVPQITKYGYTVNFNRNYALVKEKEGKIVFKAIRKGELFVVTEQAYQQAMNIEDKNQSHFKRWHERMGHLNQNDLRKMERENIVTGLKFGPTKNFECEICHRGKIHKLPFKPSTQRRDEILGLIHTDICGPMKVNSLGGARYFITFIDDATRYTEVIMLKNRSEAFTAFKNFKVRAEKETGKQIKGIRSDNAKEYVSKEFTQFLETHGIRRQLSVEYTPEQNGVAERANRTLTEMARCMIIQSGVPETLWAEAINTACFIRNRCPTSSLNNMSPLEAYSKRKPYVGFMKTFGCKAIALEKGPGIGKFHQKGTTYVMVGYSNESKAYRLWLRGTNTVVKRRDVRFIEYTENIESLRDENTITYMDLPINESRNENVTEMPDKEEIHIDEEEEEEITSEEEETIWEECEDIQIINQESGKRLPGRPKIIRTGKPGRPRKQYHEAEVMEPMHPSEIKNRTDKRF